MSKGNMGGARPNSGPKPGTRLIKTDVLSKAMETALKKPFEEAVAEVGAELFTKFKTTGDAKMLLAYLKIYSPYLIEAPVQQVEGTEKEQKDRSALIAALNAQSKANQV